MQTIWHICIWYVLFLVAIAAWQFCGFIYRYVMIEEKPDLNLIYGKHSWAVVTGASSGQGKQLALQLANRGFNLVLIGSCRSETTAEIIRKKGVKCEVVVKDFGRAFEPNFFDDISNMMETLDISILVNNVGQRSAWIPYHETPPETLKTTIACGTLVQARLTHMLLPRLLTRLDDHPSLRSAIIFMTAQCSLPNAGLAIAGLMDNPITVPYLATYEASNAFGYYHAESIIKEYTPAYPHLDLINITPGAVLTENTTNALCNTICAVPANVFVTTIMRFLGGNVANGSMCGHWGHALSGVFIAIAPWLKEPTLWHVGKRLANDYMQHYIERHDKYTI